MVRLSAALLLVLNPIPAPAQPDQAAPGRMVPVADTSLHLLCIGNGAPTVLLEAGMGGNFLDWTLVQPLIADHDLVCSYDRAGMGFSARSARPRSAQTLTDELHTLIETAGLPRPVVLVGHSFGGMLALAYARRYPADVAGIVLLDTMHPLQFARFAAAGIELQTDPHLILGRTPAAAAAYHLPERLRELAISLAQSDKQRVFEVREMTAMTAIAEQVAAAGYPHLPARVLIHGNREWDGPYPDGRMERVWAELQDDVASRIGAPPPQIVLGAGHQIALDAPDTVAAAVADLVAELHTGGPSTTP